MLSPREMNPVQSEDAAHEFQGLLKYESKNGQWKERWFVLDASNNRLIKFKLGTNPSTKAQNNVLAGGRSSRDVRIADIHGLSSKNDADTGLEVITDTGQCIRFLTNSREDEQRWLGAARKLSQGLASGIADRLAERELLAGKYALVRELGRGASGAVYLYTFQGKPYAIKKFAPQKAKGIPNRLARPPPVSDKKTKEIPEHVRREIALLKKASHLPYVIKLYDVIANHDEQQFYLVMEYMGGGAIAEWDAERKCYTCARNQKSLSLLDEKTVRTYTTNLLLGVQALHQNGLCHRDIKPENLMANEERTVCKIGDLGIAHYFRKQDDGELIEEVDPDNIAVWNAERDTRRSLVEGEVHSRASTLSRPDHEVAEPPEAGRAMLKSTKGTYQFLPPEALSGSEFDGFKADIWSIGVTLYALLFGYLPFFSTDLVKLFEKIERDPVVFPGTCRDGEVQDLLLRILEKNPEKRISIEQILEHKWMHRHVDSKALNVQVQALKRTPPVRVDAQELGSAVSVLQGRFDQLCRAVRDNSLGKLHESSFSDDHGTTAGDTDMRLDTKLTSYVPRPIDASGITLPKWIHKDLNVLATQLHFDWCRTKLLDGWVHGAVRDDQARVHPLLVPMRELTDDGRLKNVQCAEETLKCVLALGCHIGKETSRTRKQHSVGPGGLVPADRITLSWDMLLLVDLLAENSHEVWAVSYIQQGWRWGATFDDEAKTHPSLTPYMALDEVDKNLCREGIGAVLKSCVCLGYEFSCTRERPKTKRSSTIWSV